MKKYLDPRLMLAASMTIFGTLGLFVRNISVTSGELALCCFGGAALNCFFYYKQTAAAAAAAKKGNSAAFSIGSGHGYQLDTAFSGL